MVALVHASKGATAEASRRSRAQRLLLIEDDQLICELLSDHLESDGYSVDSTPSIADARRYIAAAMPALIVLDLMLPGSSGLEFLRERSTNARLSPIPVVAISAAPEGYLREAKSLGADAVLAKPFDLETLSSVVQWFVA